MPGGLQIDPGTRSTTRLLDLLELGGITENRLQGVLVVGDAGQRLRQRPLVGEVQGREQADDDGARRKGQASERIGQIQRDGRHDAAGLPPEPGNGDVEKSSTKGNS